MVRKRDTRHRAREAALQILYQWDVGGAGIDQAIDTYFRWQWPDSHPPSEAVRTFAEGLVRDTVQELAAIDPIVAATAEHWRPERMPVVDRLVLRMATCELMRGQETPAAVVIDEALELARTFSTEESVKFINGMLDAIRKKLDARP
jgi:N utilization substance protein B